MISFCVSIISFVWRTDSPNPIPDAPPDSDSSPKSLSGAVLGPRIGITCLFALGLVYFILVMRTFRSYGGSRREWRRRKSEEEERLLSDRFVREPEVMPPGGFGGRSGPVGNGHGHSSDKEVEIGRAHV